ncbi:hypothetical protein L2E68_22590 [Planktothrix agardhii 1029]|uniref:Uncharacterized protein n=1 Tax=Planktothrix agardhii (strain NIVA-CYA 126/8) TaxID=388467 RepID=A0A073CAY8_PLAA1|nr:hypothetical protein [Planktothrix agardhii]KEI65261.1 hypothetical protein A19Y_9061 [Planktothrix agardhii NIVA-CYA 126/8]MCB8766606.1 hypothetical protein [Planktothrix agardhii 1809]MCB8780249.1 hypothetical protein [Planktothrix agardhii 1031]MCB8784543.1 hypothetical protein [Planktothrix agardhii 1808]MCF3568806.1 hypothetical protein [Planktothrix agardhii 1807]
MKLQKLTHPALLPEAKNWLALCFVILTSINFVTLILHLFIASRMNSLASLRTTQVQLINGQTYYVSERDQRFRYPSVIQNFVKTWAELTFNWDSKLPGTNETDSGIKVNSKRVPTSTYFASLLMEPEFGKASLDKIADLVPSTVFSGQVRSTIIISFLSEPREIRPGEWEIDMIATRLIVDRSLGKDERIPFNRTFRIKAVEIQTATLGDQASAFEQKVYEIRSAGLEINKITEFNPQ